MKFSAAYLFLAVAGLVSALPTAEEDPKLFTRATVGSSCNQAGRVICSDSDGQRYPHILVCVSGKWQIQATCAAGTSCAYDQNNNWAWCKAY